jgi:long-chain fatty acid transport protein
VTRGGAFARGSVEAGSVEACARLVWPAAPRLVVMVAVACALLLTPSASQGQTSLQIPLQFDFINPGAKSQAMGGAFVGLADDATATFVNPAGLMLLARSEVSIEGRHTRSETPFLERGRLSGLVFNEGTDTVQGPAFGTSIGTHGGPAFASGVYVRRPSSRWRLAGYRHELVRVDQRFLSNGVFQKLPEEFTSRRDSPQEGLREVSVTGYGITAAYRPHPEVALGAGLTVYRFGLDSQFRRFDTDGFLGPPNPGVELGRSTQQGDETALAPTVGVLAGLSGRARVGVMYRHGPSFTFRTKDGGDPEREGAFRVPNTLAVGVSLRPLPEASMLVVAGEVTRVRYSRLREDFISDQARAVNRITSFGIDDGTEVHVGVQYLPTLFYGAPKLRAGVWYDPDHSVRFEPSPSNVSPNARLFDERMSAALSSGRNLVHYTGGVGFSVSPRMEVNAAFTGSPRGRVVSVSIVVR